MTIAAAADRANALALATLGHINTILRRDSNAALDCFRDALAANGAKTADLLNVRYLFAQTLDSIGAADEARAQYRMIHDVDPRLVLEDGARVLDRFLEQV